MKCKTLHATVLLIENADYCLPITTFLVHFPFKPTQNINPEGIVVISVQHTAISGLLLHLKTSRKINHYFLIVLP